MNFLPIGLKTFNNKQNREDTNQFYWPICVVKPESIIPYNLIFYKMKFEQYKNFYKKEWREINYIALSALYFPLLNVKQIATSQADILQLLSKPSS